MNPEQLAFPLLDPARACSRCRGVVEPPTHPLDPPWACWYCYAPTCERCLEERDHCGHEEAALITELLEMQARGISPLRERVVLMHEDLRDLAMAVARGRKRAASR